MKDYILYQNCVDIIENNGTIKRIFFDTNSGNTYWRYKIPNLVGTKHSGIYLGKDNYGVQYFLHNHYYVGHPCMVSAKEFGQGLPLGIYDAKCSNTPLKVIEKALTQVIRKEPYHFESYNCQGFTNDACHNHRKSEDVGKWGQRLFFGTLAYIGLSLIFSED